MFSWSSFWLTCLFVNTFRNVWSCWDFLSSEWCDGRWSVIGNIEENLQGSLWEIWTDKMVMEVEKGVTISLILQIVSMTVCRCLENGSGHPLVQHYRSSVESSSQQIVDKNESQTHPRSARTPNPFFPQFFKKCWVLWFQEFWRLASKAFEHSSARGLRLELLRVALGNKHQTISPHCLIHAS